MAVRLPPSGWFVPAILVALCVCATAQQTPVSLTYGESRATSASGSGKLFSVSGAMVWRGLSQFAACSSRAPVASAPLLSPVTEGALPW